MTAIEVNSQTLKSLLGYTMYAAARDDSRPVLHAIHLRVTTTEDGDATLHAEATDGFRLAHATAPCAIVGKDDTRAILPLDAAKNLHKQIGKWDEAMTITTTGYERKKTKRVKNEGASDTFEDDGTELVVNGVSFQSTHVAMTGRLIEGTFPEVQQLIPKEHKTEVGVRSDLLLAAVKRCAIVAKENNDVLRIDIANQDNDEYEHFLTLSANAAEMGSAVETIDAGIFQGKSMVIAFNSGYVEDVLTNGKPDGVTMRFKGPNSAGVFIPTGLPVAMSVTCVLMPMHLAA